MKPVRIALLGAGYWGTKLAREYAAISATTGDAQLEWVVDSSETALKVIKKEVHTETKFGSKISEVIKDPSVDAVHIALPNELHYEVAHAALESGKHVLLEKPLAMTSRDAFKLVAFAEESGLVLHVGHIFRFNNAIRMLRKIIQEGGIGRVNYARLSWATYMTPPKGRDIVSDLGPHPVDILNYILDEWPTSVDGIGSSYSRVGTNTEDMALVNLEFPSRVLASMYLSWIQHGAKERSVQFVGETGTLYCDALNQTVLQYTEEGRFDIPRSRFPSSRQVNGQAAVGTPSEEPNNTIRDMAYHFIDRVRGRGPQVASATVGARNVAVLEAILSSMRRTKPIQPPFNVA